MTSLRRASAFAAVTAALGVFLAAAFVQPAQAASASTSDSITIRMSVKDIWPPAPVANLTASAGAEGQMLLSWYAPDSNNNVFVASTPVSSYLIRIASFSVASVGGSTTVWWNNATNTAALPAPAISAAPPAPASPGTTQTLLINQLWPGVTYYAMIISQDASGLISDADTNSFGVQASTEIYDARPPAPTGLSIVSSGARQVTVSWNAVNVFDLDFYRVYFDSVPPYDFSHSSISVVYAPSTSTILYNLSYSTYVFKVTAVDRGVPAYPGIPLESLQTSSVSIYLEPPLHYPQVPFGIALSSDATSVSLRWMPVVRYSDFVPFVAPTAATTDELLAYHVYRATSATMGGWSDLITLSTNTWSWTDATGGPQYYYHVRAENTSGMSARSVIRTGGTNAAFIVAPDDQSFYEVLAQDVAPIEGVPGDPYSAYLFTASSRTQDMRSLNGRVIQSVQFDAYEGGLTPVSAYAMPNTGIVSLRYELSGSTSIHATSGNMSVYWYNGRAWVQLYGTADSLGQRLTIQSKFLGRYQLRTVERAGGFSFNGAGISNRFVTPNGDGKNDNVVFTYDNPHDAPVTAKILDIRGRVIVTSLPPGPISNSLMWDATAGGRPVPGGVYVYQIQAEGQTYSGTLVLIR